MFEPDRPFQPELDISVSTVSARNKNVGSNGGITLDIHFSDEESVAVIAEVDHHGARAEKQTEGIHHFGGRFRLKVAVLYDGIAADDESGREIASARLEAIMEEPEKVRAALENAFDSSLNSGHGGRFTYEQLQYDSTPPEDILGIS